MWYRTLPAALGLLLIGFTAQSLAAPNEALDRILKAGAVRVAVPDNFAPFGNLGPDAKLNGYDIDMAALVAEALGVNLKLVPVTSTDRIPFLVDGKVDLVISTLGKDPEREKQIDFTAAYAPFFSAVFGPASVQATKPADLAGRTIAVTRDTIEDTVLTQLSPASAEIKRFPDNARTEVAYLSNQVELVATGNAVAAAIFGKSLIKKTAIKFLLKNSPCYIGIPKDEPDLRTRIDAIIAAALQDGRLNAISERWLKAPIGDPEHPDLHSAAN